jgi:methionine aminopeptidase
MSIGDERDLAGLLAAGRVVRFALEAMRAAVRPGITTAELDRIAARLFERHGARSAPILVYGFPGATCISVNDEIVHGIPSRRVLAESDLVKLDVTVEKNGYMADAALTVGVGRVTPEAEALAESAERALVAGLAEARAGRRVRDIGRAVEAAPHPPVGVRPRSGRPHPCVSHPGIRRLRIGSRHRFVTRGALPVTGTAPLTALGRFSFSRRDAARRRSIRSLASWLAPCPSLGRPMTPTLGTGGSAGCADRR